MSIITNFQNLARNPLRRKALLIAEAGYGAVDIKKTVRRKIKLGGNKLSICDAMTCHSANLGKYKNIYLIGIGKGSALACVSLAKILDKKLTKGIALDVSKVKSPRKKASFLRGRQKSKIKIFVGTHPLPSKQNIYATQKIIKLAKNLKKDDLLITFICGGGSALACASKTELKASQTIFKELTKKGADIIELNTVRKHLSEINPHTKRGVASLARKNNSLLYGVGVKGGNLAKLAYPATVISLIISDVPGNDISIVASGPTVYDKTTKKDAIRILKKYLPRSSAFSSALFRDLKETPKDKKYFKKVKNVLFLSNQEPVLAMVKKAKQLGFKPKIYSLKIQGEAKYALLPLMEAIKGGEAVLAAGETTVILDNRPVGKGGRNIEAVLGAISNFQFPISKNLLVLSIASDGKDNTEAAGAISDFSTLEKAEKLKLEPQKFLDQNNSFNFFKKTGDLIFTEQKSFNVSDLMLVLSLPKE